MRSSLRQLLLLVYGALVRLRRWRRKSKNKKEAQPVFIWKDSWFLMWHISFWGFGRWVMSHFVTIRPVEGDLGPEAEAHFQRFTEIAEKDSRARSFNQRIIHPTMYRISPEAARELCLFYACVMDVAPWQYGVERRVRARKNMRTSFCISLMLFILACNLYVVGSPPLAWFSLLSFFALLISAAGWRASASLYRMAREAERLRNEEKKG